MDFSYTPLNHVDTSTGAYECAPAALDCPSTQYDTCFVAHGAEPSTQQAQIAAYLACFEGPFANREQPTNASRRDLCLKTAFGSVTTASEIAARIAQCTSGPQLAIAEARFNATRAPMYARLGPNPGLFPHIFHDGKHFYNNSWTALMRGVCATGLSTPSCVEVAHTLSLDLHLDQSQPQQSCASYPATTVAAAVRRGANLAASAFALPINWQTTGAAGQEDGSPSYVDQQAIAIGATVASCVPLPRVGIRLVLNIRVLGGLDATLRGAVDGSGQRKLTNASIEVLVRDRLRAAGLKGVIAVAGFALA
mgnify:FL=1